MLYIVTCILVNVVHLCVVEKPKHILDQPGTETAKPILSCETKNLIQIL